MLKWIVNQTYEWTLYENIPFELDFELMKEKHWPQQGHF